MGRANGNPVAAVYFNPRMVYTSERVRHANLGARRFKMSSQHSSGGKDLGGVLSDCLLLHIPNTTRLGQVHSHSKLAPSVWGGDGPFRQKLPYKIPVLEAHCTRQMDKVGGSFLNLGLFRRHGNLIKLSMEDQN